MKRRSNKCLRAALIIGLGAQILAAAPGRLDASFGTGGLVRTDLIGQPFGLEAESMVVQPDGKILVCGNLFAPGEDGESYYSSSFIARFDIRGALDTSFGTGGKIITPYGQISGNDIALQPDGKIVTVG